MKNGIIRLLAISGVAIFTACSCGDKFTPLTQEQLNAKADSLYNAQKDAKLAQFNSSCDSSAIAAANAKFESMKSEATASK